MSKQELINIITKQFINNQIPFAEGNASDVVIDNELLNAQWSTGKKSITYKAYILADEKEQTVFMWEMSKEISSGFSFGSSFESSFQSGSTLARKIKGVGYSADGKAFEYNIDLGEISKIVKDAAKQSGWKFKTVLKKEKAMY
mgnify:CR=1 FL=1